MEKIMLDLTKLSNKTLIENAARAQVLADLMEFLETRYEGVRRCSSTEITFPVGIVNNEGFTVDLGAIVAVKIPKFYDMKKKNEKFTPAYSPLEAVFTYESDPKTIRKKKKEAEALEVAKQSIVPAEEYVYDFRELDDE